MTVQCCLDLTRNRPLIRLWCPRTKSNMDDFSVPTDSQVYVDASQEKEVNSFHALKGIQGRRENSYIFYYVYRIKFLGKISHRLDSSVSRATVFRLEGPKFESWLRLTFFFVIFIIFYLELLLLYLKRAVLYENVINLIILERLKFFLVTFYYSSMKCGQDKKK